VSKADRIADISPTVVFESLSTFNTSLSSVARAAETEVLAELLEEPELVELPLVDVPLVAVDAVAVEAVVVVVVELLVAA
jgi:hypothetical protein